MKVAVFVLIMLTCCCKSWAQPVIIADDRIESVNEYCEYTLSPLFDIQPGPCTAGELSFVEIAVDVWQDGSIDYVISSNVTYRNWTEDAALASLKGYPSTTLFLEWKVLKSEPANESFEIPEDLGGRYSSHILYYTAVDACGDSSLHTQVYEVRDLTGPVANELSLASLLFQDPDGRGPIPASVEVVASDYNLVSYDNCSAQDELIYLLDGVLPVIDSTVEVGDSLIRVGLDVAHYFDLDGFVSLDIPSFNVCDFWDSVAYRSLMEYYGGDIYRWDPAYRTSSKLMVYDPDHRSLVISFVVGDQALNLSDTSRVYVINTGHGFCPPETVYTPYVGSFIGGEAILYDDCSIDIRVDYDPSVFCPESIDTTFAAIAIADASRDETLLYAAYEVPSEYADWTTDTILAERLSFDSSVRFKHLPVLIEGQAPNQLNDLLSSLPVTGVASFDLSYSLVSSQGHTARQYQRHTVYDTIPPELVGREVVAINPDSNGLVEISATDVLESTTDNCDYTDLLIYNFDDIQPLFIRRPDIACRRLSAIDHLYRSEHKAYIIIEEGVTLAPEVLQEYRAGLWHRWSPAERTAYRYIEFDQDCSPIGVTVQARDSNGNQSAASALVQCTDATSTSDPATSWDVNFYPNPATDHLYVDWHKGDQSKPHIALRSIDGRELQIESSAADSQNQEFDISGLTPGLYILQVSDDKGIIYTQKVIVQ